MWRWVPAGLLAACVVTPAELDRALDRDGDGFLPVEVGGDDCWEGRADVNPGALELCGDGIDNDCDGVADDDGVGRSTFFRDVDGDGWGTDEAVDACEVPPGFAENAGDCDDDDAAFNPGVEDLCDGVDQNCDGQPDDASILTPRYRDADGDQFGVDGDTVLACTDVAGYVLEGGDCDDGNENVSPAALDGCNGIDDDCDGVADDASTFALYFRDQDGDGVGTDLETRLHCADEAGWSGLPGDCDDLDSTISVLAVDLCDGVDQDCDGVIDEDAAFALWYPDGDGDGVGDASVGVETCGSASGYVLESGDCDDGNAEISPLITDLCDGVDQDCDSVVDEDAVVRLWFLDGDGDGSGLESDAVEACAPVAGRVDRFGDCDDGDASVRPGSVDPCDGVDQDCDGALDEDAAFESWFRDQDGDGMGRSADPASTCDGAPAGHVAQAGDCNDTNASVTIPRWFRDQDGDSYGTSSFVSACTRPNGYVGPSGDCDDARPAVNPGRTEVCNNGRDDDCDPETDCRWSGSVPADSGLVIPLPAGAVRAYLVPHFIGDPARPNLVICYADRCEFHQVDATSGAIGPSLMEIPETVVHTQDQVDIDGDNKPDVVALSLQRVAVYGSASQSDQPLMQVVLAALSSPSAIMMTVPGWGPGLWLSDEAGPGRARFFPYSLGAVLADSSHSIEIQGAPSERFGALLSSTPPDSLGRQSLIVTSLPVGGDGRVSVFMDFPGTSLASSSAAIEVDGPIGSQFLRGFGRDMNGDGQGDLVISGFDRGNGLVEGFLTVHYGPLVQPGSAINPLSIMHGIGGQSLLLVPIADVDRDGWIDVLAVAEGNTSQLPSLPFLYGRMGEWSVLDADAYFFNSQGLGAPFASFDGAADVNGDNHDDIALRVEDGGVDLHILLSTGP